MIKNYAEVFVYKNIFMQKLTSLFKEWEASLKYLKWQLGFLED